MRDTNISNLAGEFLVAGELSRRGYPVSITMGKAKAVDIYADAKKETIKVDTKASRYRTSWPVGKVDKDVYYIFVSLQNEKEVSENKPPAYFIISGREIIEKNIVTKWKSIPASNTPL